MMASLCIRLVVTQKVAVAMSLVMMGISLATILAAPLGTIVGEYYGWRFVFLCASVMGLGTLIVQLFALPSMPSSKATGNKTFRSALKNPPIAAGLVVLALVITGHFASFTFIRSLWENVLSINVQEISYYLLVFGVFGFLGNIFSGRVSAKRPDIATILTASLVVISTLTMFVFGEYKSLIIITTALWGFGFGGFPVAISVWTANADRNLAETSGALSSSVFQIAIAIGATTGGIVLEMAGARFTLMATILLALVGTAIMCVNRLPSRRSK